MYYIIIIYINHNNNYYDYDLPWSKTIIIHIDSSRFSFNIAYDVHATSTLLHVPRNWNYRGYGGSFLGMLTNLNITQRELCTSIYTSN